MVTLRVVKEGIVTPRQYVVVAVGLAALTVSACTTVTPSLAPEVEARAVMIPMKGVNGLRGRFTTATLDGREVTGTYRGSGTRTTWFETESRGVFRTEFDIEAPGQAAVRSRCRAEVQDSNIPFTKLSVQVTPMTYACAFTEGKAVVGGLQLFDTGAPVPLTDREAGLTWKGREYVLISEHEDRETGLVLDRPLGFSIYRGETAVGGVNTAGERTLYIMPDADADEEAAVRAAGLALALLSDPSR